MTNVLLRNQLHSPLKDIPDIVPDYAPDEKRIRDDCGYQLINIAALEKLLQEQLVCRCTVDRDIDNFLRYCARHGKKFTIDDLKKHKVKWKNLTKKNNSATTNLSVSTENIGLEAIVNIHCSQCSKSFTIPNETTRYDKGTNYNGDKYNTENCSWFASNVKLVVGTLAAGMGAADISCLFSFLGLPNLHSFCNRQYKRIENLIGKHIRDVANESMETALDLEVSMTQEYKGIPVTDWRQQDNSLGLTLSYDMGWSKRSSGNTYNSLSGHGFLIGCFSKKIVDAQVTS